MALKFLKYLFILYFTFFSVSPTFASSISPLTVPTGGQVASGTININQSAPGKLVVNQTTNQGIINWQSFNVGVDAAVHFNTPNASAGTLNNISGGSSTILGSIYSNGRLFFANPSGIIFKPGSQVKAEGLVAGAMRISNQDFLANNFNFTNNQIASLQNEGNLEAHYVALIAPQVLNKGTITTNVATIIAAGDDVKLAISDSNRLSVNINPAKIKTLSSNEGVIKSENGTVSIQANVAQELIDQTINTPKSADKLISENGVIKLVSNTGSIKAKNVNLSAGPLGGTEVSGTIDASSNAKGGDIEITGKEIQVKSNSKLLATGETGGGNILVGGDWQGSNGVLQATYTTVEKDSLIDASSKGVGDGGKIVVWSDIHNSNSKTVAQGKLYAKANIGDGGKIETSGYALNIENVDPNTSSVQGLYGEFLIDPYNYEIDSDAWNNINTSLNTTNVSISTGSSNTSFGRSNSDDLSGRIAFHSGNRTYTHNRDATLTLTAANKVEFDANISTTSHKLNIIANADKVEGAGNLNLRNGILTVNVSESDSSKVDPYSGVLSNLSLNKQGVGMLKLSGTNTYTGTTTISAGTLSASSLADTTALSVASGATYKLDQNDAVASIAGYGNINLQDKTLTIAGASNTDFYGIISGTGALTKSGSGTLTLWETNTYSGATTVSAGTLSASSLADTTALSVASGATYQLKESDTVASIAGAGNIDLQNKILTIAGASNTNFSGIISGLGGALTKSGSGTLTLSGTNTYTGATTVSAGTLAVTANGALGSNLRGTTVASGATLDFQNINYSTTEALTVNGGTIKTSTGASTVAGTIALGANSTFDVGGTSLTSSGVISGASKALTKSGSGTLTLRGANTYSGNTTISAGKLSITPVADGLNQSHIYSPSYSISSGATLEYNNPSLTAINLRNDVAYSGQGTLSKIGVGQISWGHEAATFALGSGSLIDVQQGTLVGGSSANENWTNNFSNLNIASGANFSGVEAAIRIDALTGAGTLSTGLVGYDAGITMGVNNTQAGIYNSAGSATFTGVITNSDNSNPGKIIKTGSGTQILSGTNTYSGTTTVSAGTLSVTGTLGSGTYAGNIANSGTLAMGSNSNQTLSGVVSGAGALTKSGSGTLTLSGTYTGTPVVSSGTVVARGTTFTAPSTPAPSTPAPSTPAPSTPAPPVNYQTQVNIEKASVVKIISNGTNAVYGTNNNMTFNAFAGPNFSPSPTSGPKNIGPAAGASSGPQIISRFVTSTTNTNNVKNPVRLRQTNLGNKPIQIQPNNQPAQIQPNNQPIQIQPNNQPPLTQPNNQQNPIQSPIGSGLTDESL